MRTEIYDAIVTDNDDEEKRGRVEYACAGLMGDEETPLPEWAVPSLDWGWFVVPDIGEIIEIEVIVSSETDESYGQSSIGSLNAKWKGKRAWTSSETDGDNVPRPIPEDFQTNYGKRRGFATPAGHIMYFDDTTGKEKVHISQKLKDGYQMMSMDEKGGLVIANKGGTMIYMNSEDKEFTIIDENSNMIATSPDGIKLIDKFSNIIELKENLIQILGQGAITVNGGVCDIKCATINLLDGANQKVVLGDLFMTMFNLHTHPTGTGPSGPVTPPGMTIAQLSGNCKVGV